MLTIQLAMFLWCFLFLGITVRYVYVMKKQFLGGVLLDLPGVINGLIH